MQNFYRKSPGNTCEYGWTPAPGAVQCFVDWRLKWSFISLATCLSVMCLALIIEYTCSTAFENRIFASGQVGVVLGFCVLQAFGRKCMGIVRCLIQTDWVFVCRSERNRREGKGKGIRHAAFF
jgi:hypothetical protein